MIKKAKACLNVIVSWRRNSDQRSNYFQYNHPINRMHWTTHIIEKINQQLRKTRKTKGAFTCESARMKWRSLILYRIAENWDKLI